jgi:GT2 family glycosyltransferase
MAVERATPGVPSSADAGEPTALPSATSATSAEPCTLSVIIVNWNVCELLARCLNSVAAGLGGAPGLAPLAYEVIVADNASSDGSLAMLERDFPWVRRLALGRNFGFAAGNNRGLAVARGRYLLLLNPDTEIVGASLMAMLDYIGKHPDIGLLGPQLRYPDGSVQSSRRRFPVYAVGFFESTILRDCRPAQPLLRRYYMADAPDDAPHDADWLVGACLLMPRAVWEQVGPLDERFFMYSEELDYAWRVRRAGWRVAYLPAAQVIHYEGGSSDKVSARRLIMFHTAKAQLYAKYFGAPRGGLLRLFLLATFVYQWLEEAIKWALGHKRTLRRQRLAAYAAVLRSGLRPARVAPPSRAEE